MIGEEMQGEGGSFPIDTVAAKINAVNWFEIPVKDRHSQPTTAAQDRGVPQSAHTGREKGDEAVNGNGILPRMDMQ